MKKYILFIIGIIILILFTAQSTDNTKYWIYNKNANIEHTIVFKRGSGARNGYVFTERIIDWQFGKVIYMTYCENSGIPTAIAVSNIEHK